MRISSALGLFIVLSFFMSCRTLNTVTMEKNCKEHAQHADKIIKTVNLKTAYFDFDSSDPNINSMDSLSSNVKDMTGVNVVHVFIEAHTDSKGSSGYNFELSYQRGLAVSQYYKMFGISPELISVTNYGYSKPVCKEKNKECDSRNRRVETKILIQEVIAP